MSTQILHKHCFQFLLGLTIVPRENKQNLEGQKKEYYGIFEGGLSTMTIIDKICPKLQEIAHIPFPFLEKCPIHFNLFRFIVMKSSFCSRS